MQKPFPTGSEIGILSKTEYLQSVVDGGFEIAEVLPVVGPAFWAVLVGIVDIFVQGT